eukprot:NODE_1571_length_1489_cov_129.792361_g1417_i0.p1 GENE.NODE_1571_length_1489_cov_129.792361_g1417_i0~~NODE_1571_length_1489_cov_129.792361_g1417_i0.p1  ORF type:complete len:165 (+),score=27.53 NODE_1571_length_1489_cov_129.792361_g1417_i0:802-1296(+)
MEADPLFNGANVVRSIQHMRVPHRLPCGPEQPHIRVPGAPLHPWSMYTNKGDFFFGVGTKIAKNYYTKFAFGAAALFSAAYGITFFYAAAGPRAKTMTRAWKEAEADPRYPLEQLPDLYLPPNIPRDPQAECWRIVDLREEPLVITIQSYMKNRWKVAKQRDNC